jgi:photosystem II stability/assembly factor-like uncharacterized protein
VKTFYLFIALILINLSSLDAQWYPLQIAPDYPRIQSFEDFCFVNGNSGWIVGEVPPVPNRYGIIYHTKDGGHNWALQDSVEDVIFYRIQMLNLNIGWSLGLGYVFENGQLISGVWKIYNTTDGGNTWNYQSAFTQTGNSSIANMLFINDSTGWVFGDAWRNGSYLSAIFKTTTGGKTWTTYDVEEKYSIIGGYFISDSVGWAYGFVFDVPYPTPREYVLLKTTNGGINWDKIWSSPYESSNGYSFQGINFLYFSDNNNGGYFRNNTNDTQSIFEKTTDGGITWSGRHYFYSAVYASCIDSEYNIYTFRYEDSNIVASNNSGAFWGTKSDKFPVFASKLIFITKDTAYGLSITGTLYKSTNGGGITSINNISETVPKEFYISQNYPNPFNPATIINYSIPKESFVTIKVYDFLGREVATLVNEEKSAGEYGVQFNGSKLASGIYFYKITAGSFVQTIKMILMK